MDVNADGCVPLRRRSNNLGHVVIIEAAWNESRAELRHLERIGLAWMLMVCLNKERSVSQDNRVLLVNDRVVCLETPLYRSTHTAFDFEEGTILQRGHKADVARRQSRREAGLMAGSGEFESVQSLDFVGGQSCLPLKKLKHFSQSLFLCVEEEWIHQRQALHCTAKRRVGGVKVLRK
jgi:hypothetical protein